MPAVPLEKLAPIELPSEMSDDERWARKILGIFAHKATRPGGRLSRNQVHLQFQTEDGRQTEFRAGETFAVAADWLVLDREDLVLTDAGHKESQR